MADTEAAPVATTPPTLSPAKKEKKAKNPRAKPTHPPTSEMVNNAIKGLKERGGSSLQAIKKYIAANYKVDAEKVSPFIKKYLKSAVVSGALVQTKGKGASGSFKLAASGSGAAKQASSDKKKTAVRAKKSPVKKAAAGEKPKTVKKAVTKAKKTSAEKKSPKKVAEKKTAKLSGSTAGTTAVAVAAVKAKSPSKAKKSNKAGPTKKPKAPKPKTAKSPAASKAKKAASPKRKK